MLIDQNGTTLSLPITAAVQAERVAERCRSAGECPGHLAAAPGDHQAWWSGAPARGDLVQLLAAPDHAAYLAKCQGRHQVIMIPASHTRFTAERPAVVEQMPVCHGSHHSWRCSTQRVRRFMRGCAALRKGTRAARIMQRQTMVGVVFMDACGGPVSLVQGVPITAAPHDRIGISVHRLLLEIVMPMRTHPRESPSAPPRWYDIRVTLGRLFLRRPSARYGSALVVVSGVTTLALLLPFQLDGETLQLLYVLAVLTTAVLSGFGPAMVAATSSFLCFNFFFVVPQYSLWVARPEDGLRLVEFWVAALLSGALAAYARHQTDQAERRVTELSMLHTLTRAIDAESTLQGRVTQIAMTTAHLLDLPFCGVTLRVPACTATWGDQTAAVHWLAIPIHHEGMVIGELQAGLPTTHRHVTAEDHHLLRLITSQLISVLDRARMLDAAAQARVFQESDQLKSAILSSLSHDLRTPLTTIQGAVSELKATDVAWTAATRTQLLDAIDEQTQRLRRLVGNLLDLSRVRGRALLPHLDWYSLDEILYHALDSQQALLAGHVVTVQHPPTLPLARLDFVLTEQVIVNLLQNAVQHGAPDTALAISIMADGGMLICRITNSGPPIPPAWQAHIFEPFIQGPGGPAGRGSGLGLAICKGFIEAQGGTIALDTTHQDGVRITFTLPLPPPEGNVHDTLIHDHRAD